MTAPPRRASLPDDDGWSPAAREAPGIPRQAAQRSDWAAAQARPVGPVAGHEQPADDATLLEQSRRNPEHFAEIYARYFAEIYRYMAGRLGRDAADDLAAETFLIAFRRRAAFDPKLGSVRPWLYGIATNLVSQRQRDEIRRYRALGKSGPGLADDAEQEERIADRLTAAALRGPLARAVAELSARDRDVLLLVALGGFSYDEVAAALSIRAGTVGSRLNRARRKVRSALAGLYPIPNMDDLDDRTGNDDASYR
jgi:RNA polymerase sigma factor (sigma-70 family)